MKQIIKNFLDNHFFVYIDKFLSRPNLDNGLIELTAEQIIKAKDFVYNVLGATNKRVIKEDGNLEAFIPKGEQQNKPFEKMFCVSENGICNSIETNFNYFIHLVNEGKADEEIQELVKIFRHFGLIRGNKCLLDTEYVASGSGTTRRGNSYKQVANFIRHNGLVPKGSYPAYTKWNELYYPAGGTWINGNRVPADLLKLGRKLVEFVDFTYEWVTPQNHDKAVKRGAFGTSCYAWLFPNNDGIYQRVNFHKNHAVYKFCKGVPTHKKIGDSYKPFVKKLAPDYNMGYGMLLSFAVKKPFTIYNEKAINEFQKKRKVNYLLLVERYKDFDPGLYRIKTGSLEKMELPEAVEIWIRELSREGKLIGINSKDFSQFIT